MKPSRPIPVVGMAATVRYLAADVPGVVTAVQEDGRRVTVRTEEGETVTFALNRSTGFYQAPEYGPRLSLEP